MDIRAIFQLGIFFTAIVFITVMPLYVKSIKDKYQKYGVYSIYLWFVHVFIFYSAVLLTKYTNIMNTTLPSSWPAVLIWHISITLFLKEILEIQYTKSKG